MKQIYNIKLATGQRSADDSKMITFLQDDILDFLSRKENIGLLERYIKNTDSLLPLHNISQKAYAFRFALQHNFEDIQEMLMDEFLHSYENFVRWFPINDIWSVGMSC